MIYIVCTHCHSCLRISPGQDGELEALIGPHDAWYPDAYPCFECGEAAAFTPAVDSQLLFSLRVVEVSPVEALAALNGLGVPEERECGPAAIERLLVGASIKTVATRMIRNTHRSVIEYIELEDGARLYLASGSHGATAYRIYRPPNYARAHGG